MPNEFVGPLLCGLISVCVLVTGTPLNFHLTNSDGFFLKPLFHGQDFYSLNKVEKHFFLTELNAAPYIEATYGHGFLHARDQISQGLLQRAKQSGNGTFSEGFASSSYILVDSWFVSAHLVSRLVSQERPLLQVLFDASHIGAEGPTPRTRIAGLAGVKADDDWCMQVHINEDGKTPELTGSCQIGHQDPMCVATVGVPLTWWDVMPNFKPKTLHVFVSSYKRDAKSSCVSAPYGSSVPGKAVGNKQLLSVVSLSQGPVTYQELNEDQHILLCVPQKSFFPGSKFKMPVKLQVGTDLTFFTLKMKARRGLRVVGVEQTDSRLWTVMSEISSNKKKATVTARRSPNAPYNSKDRVQNVLDWVMEVAGEGEDDQSEQDYARVTITLQYTTGGFGSVENQVQARVQLQKDNIYTIVPVIKSTSIMNVAKLTGKKQSYPMKVMAIAQSGALSDITTHTTCHSGDEGILKVTPTCQLVYVDGSERGGADNVNLIAKYGRHTHFLFFRVWVPEIPLQVELSDSRLSAVDNWPVSSQDGASSADRDDRSPGADDDDDDDGGTCSVRYQQSLVEVYARFVSPDSAGREQFLLHQKALFRVTDLVKNNLHITDGTVATLQGTIVQGLRPGITKIQVLSAKSEPVGSQDVSVVPDKVGVKLLAYVVSDLHLDVRVEEEMPGSLATKIKTDYVMTYAQQKAILDLVVLYSDSSQIPLHLVPDDDYHISLMTLNPKVVTFGSPNYKHTPIIRAMGEGEGQLVKVTLEQGDSCKTQKSEPIAETYITVKVKFQTDKTDGQDNVQNDYPDDGRGDQVGGLEGPRGVLYYNPADPGTTRDSTVPSHEAQQQPIAQRSRRLSTLEIVMYVLLAVFGVAIVVFLVNCFVFMSRHQKRKSVPEEKAAGEPGVRPTEPGARPVSGAGILTSAVSVLRRPAPRDRMVNDWVWIGRETLERHSVDTRCSLALMPDHEFSLTNHLAKFMLPTPAPVSRHSGHSGGSNRNSGISTYQGSECSIRITANPLAAAPPPDGPRQSNTLPKNRPITRPLLRTFHSGHYQNVPSLGYSSHPPAHHYLSDIQSASALSTSSLDERGSCSSLPSRDTLSLQEEAVGSLGRDVSALCDGDACGGALGTSVSGAPQRRLGDLAPPRRRMADREMDVANGNLTDSSLEWEHDGMGLSYKELMEYFDNLKESSA